MAALSYQLEFTQTAPGAGTPGMGLEAVTVGTAAPTSGAGFVEIRVDQTTTAITDGSLANGVTTRALRRNEIMNLIMILEQYIERDTAVAAL